VVDAGVIAELFQKDVRTINEHLVNIFEEGELEANSVIRKFRITAADGKNYATQHYNLSAILAVGYRVRSHRGTQFRQWATARLSEYLVKVHDGRRAAQEPAGPGRRITLTNCWSASGTSGPLNGGLPKGAGYYATSVDYTPDAEASHQFFAAVQNKMHWAAHGQTAAEVIHSRADAATAHGVEDDAPGGIIRKEDVAIAKNYLNEDELQVLNRIVNLYVEYAELQALERKPMTMRDWITKLDEFLKSRGASCWITQAGFPPNLPKRRRNWSMPLSRPA